MSVCVSVCWAHAILACVVRYASELSSLYNNYPPDNCTLRALVNSGVSTKCILILIFTLFHAWFLCVCEMQNSKQYHKNDAIPSYRGKMNGTKRQTRKQLHQTSHSWHIKHLKHTDELTYSQNGNSHVRAAHNFPQSLWIVYLFLLISTRFSHFDSLFQRMSE